MKVLLIEDNDTMRDGMAQILKKMGHQVSEARDGESGLVVFNEHIFQLVITDYKMAGADGIQVLKKIKQKLPEHILQVYILVEKHN